jgi:hypothetical protein
MTIRTHEKEQKIKQKTKNKIYHIRTPGLLDTDIYELEEQTEK